MKVVIPLSHVNEMKICPICGEILPADCNFCPHESEKVRLLPIEIDILN